MLPNILDVAQKYGLTFHPKHYGKKETLAKCPFCREDAQPAKRKKYYLSLNTKDNVFKCWFCRESGGVLQFEAMLGGKPYNEVKEKYCGKHKGPPLHPAYRLNPYQLEQIGWKTYKRDHLRDFQRKKEAVLRDWKSYVHDELAKHFAMFMCIAHLENQKHRQFEMLAWFIQKCWDVPIPGMFYRIQNEFLKDGHERKEWARLGTDIGRAAWKTSMKTMDIEMKQVILNVLMVDYFLRLDKKEQVTIQQCSQ